MIALRGKLYTGEITTVSGDDGTEVQDIDARVIPITFGPRQRVFGRGWEMDKATVIGGGASKALLIDLRVRQFTAASFDLILAPYKLDGGGYAPDGTGAEGRNETRSGAAMIVRPVDTNGLYLYVPNATLAPLPIVAQYSDDAPSLDGQSIQFVATRGENSTEPAWMLGTPAQIASVYSGLSAGGA